MKKLSILIINCLLACLSGMALAERAYVADTFKITVRSGESTDHRILGVLATGASVNVIKRNSTSGYAKVKTSNGLEGYVLQRHLTTRPIARQRLEQLEKELESLKGAPDEMRKKMLAAKAQYAELKKQHDETSKVKRQLEAKYTSLQRTAANAVRTTNERNELRKKVADLTRSNEELKQEKSELENQDIQRWFLIGAGVTLGGVLIGLLLPHLHVSSRRKDGWGSL